MKKNRFKKFLGWKDFDKPHITLNDEFYELLAPFRLPLILTILIMMFGTLGYIIIDDMTLLDAMYQTGITFTTVGFGEMAPISNIGRIFTISLIIFGFLIFSISVGIIVEVLNKSNLQKIIRERNMLYTIARLKNHFVICYHNEFTIQVSKQLRKSHIPFVVIDPVENFHKIAKEYKYPYYIESEPHTEIAILKSFLSSAKGVIILSKNIADNIATIASVRLYEKEIHRRKPYLIIVNANSNSDEIKLLKLGANKVVTPTNMMAERVNAIASRPDMENLLEEFLYKRDTKLDMEEVKIPRISWLTLKKIGDTHLRKNLNVAIIGIKYKNGNFIPMPKEDVIILEGSKLLLIGDSKNISMVKEIIKQKIKPEEYK